MMGKIILDKMAMQRALTRITYEIVEKNKGVEDLVLIGIKTRGIFLANRIANRLQQLENVTIPVGELDITNYRDDIEHDSMSSDVKMSNNKIDFSIEGKRVILVDDVLYTGRTVRAALSAVMDLGRPKSINLAVLVDRGHRELPIRADFVGKNIPSSQKEKIKVYVSEIDDKDAVELIKVLLKMGSQHDAKIFDIRRWICVPWQGVWFISNNDRGISCKFNYERLSGNYF
ncbi:putative pyrimidine operon regulatory protein/uracil phosphoribosyltransferase PyrR [Lentilactobacillus kisonensis F0435]|uniref:Bifunctional protein PyrR n=3 Tax=Lentilactobacillus kisonensis TaxID=481722 RepID=H1LG89_9LACO|nr:putative pyrimidine operon regulatory protein/uracil phosphoribosyltransferase PyrR [Lentilactobacillus kisonensis F0435]